MKLEIFRQKKIIQINETRLTNKDDEILKTHAVIDKLNQDVLIGEVRESELKQAVERIRVFEEEALDPPHELVKEKETLQLHVRNLKQQVKATDVTLASKDVELTMAYEIIDNFKQDILTLTEQLETMKSLRHQRH